MTIRNVVIYPDEILRKPNATVSIFDEELKQLCADMFDTMYKNEGIGLAAPQIGINKKIVVIDIPSEDDVQGKNQMIFINPKITKLEGELVESQEGCLSVPGYQDTVMRYPRISVSYQDLNGQNQELNNIDGLLAICLQHETDHLNGVIFVDKLSRLKQDRLKKKYGKILKDLHKGE